MRRPKGSKQGPSDGPQGTFGKHEAGSSRDVSLGTPFPQRHLPPRLIKTNARPALCPGGRSPQRLALLDDEGDVHTEEIVPGLVVHEHVVARLEVEGERLGLADV